MSDDDGDAPDNGTADGGVTRRRALQILGAVPVAAALGAQQQTAAAAEAAHARRHVADANAAVASVGRGPHGLPLLQRARVENGELLADYIIPRDEHSGSATDAKVPEYMDFLLSEKDASLNTQTAMRGGLAWLDTECRKRFRQDVHRRDRRAAAPGARRHRLSAKAKPEMSYGVSFFNRFRDMTASGFYSSAIGWQDAASTSATSSTPATTAVRRPRSTSSASATI